MSVGEFAQLLTALAVCGNVCVSWLNNRKLSAQARKIDAVSESTNGLSQRNEAIARKLGVAEGTAAEKASHP